MNLNVDKWHDIHKKKWIKKYKSLLQRKKKCKIIYPESLYNETHL